MSEELASVKEIVNLTSGEALDRARAFLMRQGYRPVHRTDTCLIVERFRPSRIFGGEVLIPFRFVDGIMEACQRYTTHG